MKNQKKTWFGLPIMVVFLLIHKIFERLSYYLVASFIKNYFKFHEHYDPENAQSLSALFTFLFWSSALAGGYISDSCLGKFWTVIAAGIGFIIGGTGFVFMTYDALSWLLWPSIVIFAVCGGIMMPSVSSYAGDQLRDNPEKTESFFGAWYYMIQIGGLSAPLVAWGFLGDKYTDATSADWRLFYMITPITAGLAFACVAAFWNSGHREPPKKAIIKDIAKILYRSRTQQESELVAEFGQESYDMAMSLKLVIKPFLCLAGYFVVCNLGQTFFDDQAQYCADLFTGFPQMITQAYDGLSCLIMCPIVFWIVKCLRKRGFKVTHQQRMLTGIIVCCINFAYASFLHWLIRYKWVNSLSKIHVTVQYPIWILAATAETLIYCTGLDYAFTAGHPKLKGTIMSIFYACLGFGSLIAAGLMKAFNAGLPVDEVDNMPSNYNAVYQTIVYLGLMILTLCVFYFSIDFTEIKPHGIDDEEEGETKSETSIEMKPHADVRMTQDIPPPQIISRQWS